MGTDQQGYVPPPVYAQAPQQPGWFSRHWKLLVFGGIGLVLLLVVLFVGGIVLFVFGIMKSNEPYQHAVAAAQANVELQRALGTPIETGWWVSGQINTSGPSGNADLAIPIHGPQGKATLYVVARKSAGEWVYNRLEAEVETTHVRTNLLPPGQRGAPADQGQPAENQ